MRDRKRLKRIIRAQEANRDVAKADLAERRLRLEDAEQQANVARQELTEASQRLGMKRAVGASELADEADAVAFARTHAAIAKNVVEEWIRSCEEQSEVMRISAIRVRSLEQADQRLAQEEAHKESRRESRELDDISAGRQRSKKVVRLHPKGNPEGSK